MSPKVGCKPSTTVDGIKVQLRLQHSQRSSRALGALVSLHSCFFDQYHQILFSLILDTLVVTDFPFVDFALNFCLICIVVVSNVQLESYL